jgi:hypothetical protein
MFNSLSDGQMLPHASSYTHKASNSLNNIDTDVIKMVMKLVKIGHPATKFVALPKIYLDETEWMLQ